MASLEDLRRLALALPDAWENTYRDDPWFQVGKKSFALRSNGRFIFKLEREHQHFLFEVRPQTFQPCKVGTGGVWSYVALADLDEAELADFVLEAWSGIVPKKLSKAYLDGDSRSRAAPETQNAAPRDGVCRSDRRAGYLPSRTPSRA